MANAKRSSVRACVFVASDFREQLTAQRQCLIASKALLLSLMRNLIPINK